MQAMDWFDWKHKIEDCAQMACEALSRTDRYDPAKGIPEADVLAEIGRLYPELWREYCAFAGVGCTHGLLNFIPLTLAVTEALTALFSDKHGGRHFTYAEVVEVIGARHAHAMACWELDEAQPIAAELGRMVDRAEVVHVSGGFFWRSVPDAAQVHARAAAYRAEAERELREAAALEAQMARLEASGWFDANGDPRNSPANE